MIDVQKYIDAGYTREEVMEAMRDVQQEQGQVIRAAPTMIAGRQEQENLIKWQLELDSILERIEHILKGDKPKMQDGNLIFIEAQKDEERIFNEYGVSEIMRILTMYLNRNTILSNYDEDTINWKVLDFGHEVSDLIFLKYNEMGLDTIAKRKRYAMVVKELVDTVHSGYLRALHGGERNSLRTARSVQQSEPLNSQGMGNYPMMPKERSVFNPMRLLKGKYV